MCPIRRAGTAQGMQKYSIWGVGNNPYIYFLGWETRFGWRIELTHSQCKNNPPKTAQALRGCVKYCLPPLWPKKWNTSSGFCSDLTVFTQTAEKERELIACNGHPRCTLDYRGRDVYVLFLEPDPKIPHKDIHKPMNKQRVRTRSNSFTSFCIHKFFNLPWISFSKFLHCVTVLSLSIIKMQSSDSCGLIFLRRELFNRVLSKNMSWEDRTCREVDYTAIISSTFHSPSQTSHKRSTTGKTCCHQDRMSCICYPLSNSIKVKCVPNITTELSALLLRVWNVPGSNLGLETGYSN